MKRIISLILLIVFMICNTCFSVSASDVDTIQFYVDGKAQTTGDGSIGSPFQTLEEAQNAIRDLKKAGNYPAGGITVNIREGIYTRSTTFTLSDDDSGIEGAPVTWRAYANETVKLVGGTEISLSDCSVSQDSRVEESLKGKIYEFNLLQNGIAPYDKLYVTGHSQYYLRELGLAPDYLQTPEVFYNDEITQLARYPNEGYMVVSDVIQEGDVVYNWTSETVTRPEYVPPEQRNDPPIPMTFSVADKRIDRWANAKDAWVFGYWYHDWSDQTTPIRQIDVSKGTIQTELPSCFGLRSGQRFYIYNLFEEMDIPGEWYYDRDNGNLYIYPKDNNPNSKILLAFSSNDVLAIDGAKYINWFGVTFTGTRASGVLIQDSDYIKLSYCSVNNVSNSGIQVRGGTNVVIEGCSVYGLGGQGIYLSGGDLNTLTPTNHKAVNNHIYNFGRLFKTYQPGVKIEGSVGNYVGYNLIHDGPHAGLIFTGNDNIIEYNEIHSVMKEASDMGAIYTGASRIKRGNVLRGNVIHDIYSDSTAHPDKYCIYLDDCYSGTTITENLMYNVGGGGVFINGGRNNDVTNNVFVNMDLCSMRLLACGRAIEWFGGKLKELHWYGLGDDMIDVFTSETYAKYPNMTNILEDEPYDPKYNVFKNNISFNVEDEFEIRPEVGGSTYTMTEMLEDNQFVDGVIAMKDPGFVDPKANNYSLKPDSEVFTKLPEFVNIKPEKAGLITSRLRSILEKDAIAMGVGKPSSYVNWQRFPFVEEDYSITPYSVEENVYVPLRFVVENIGGNVTWTDGTINIECNGDSISLTVGSKTAVVNDANVELSDAVALNGERTYLPTGIINQLFGYEVFTDESGVVVISKASVENLMDVEMAADLYNRLW